MIIQQDESSATYQINRYEPGKIWINQQCYNESLILRPHRLQTWRPRQLNELCAADFLSLEEDLPKILLLGTGKDLLIPPEELFIPFFQKGIGVEFMDSRAACHTFTVLASEERAVAACILII